MKLITTVFAYLILLVPFSGHTSSSSVTILQPADYVAGTNNELFIRVDRSRSSGENVYVFKSCVGAFSDNKCVELVGGRPFSEYEANAISDMLTSYGHRLNAIYWLSGGVAFRTVGKIGAEVGEQIGRWYVGRHFPRWPKFVVAGAVAAGFITSEGVLATSIWAVRDVFQEISPGDRYDRADLLDQLMDSDSEGQVLQSEQSYVDLMDLLNRSLTLVISCQHTFFGCYSKDL